MGRKQKQISYSSSSGSDSESSSYTSQCQSQSSSSHSSSQCDNKLTKKQLKQLIKLEKKIKKQEKILKKQKKAKKSKFKQQPTKQQIMKKYDKAKTKEISSVMPDVGEGRKLFITGIQDKYSQGQVAEQLKHLLNPIQGVIDFRIKRKQGCHTYAFVDFQTKYQAKQGMEKLRKKKIFGEKIAIYFSQDQEKQKVTQKPRQKKCFQCNGTGHFARQCQLRNMQSSPMDNEKTSLWVAKDEADNRNTTGQTEMEPQPRNQANADNEEQKMSRKRVIREKNRLSRFSNRDG